MYLEYTGEIDRFKNLPIEEKIAIGISFDKSKFSKGYPVHLHLGLFYNKPLQEKDIFSWVKLKNIESKDTLFPVQFKGDSPEGYSIIENSKYIQKIKDKNPSIDLSFTLQSMQTQFDFKDIGILES